MFFTFVPGQTFPAEFHPEFKICPPHINLGGHRSGCKTTSPGTLHPPSRPLTEVPHIVKFFHMPNGLEITVKAHRFPAHTIRTDRAQNLTRAIAALTLY